MCEGYGERTLFENSDANRLATRSWSSGVTLVLAKVASVLCSAASPRAAARGVAARVMGAWAPS